MMSEDTAYDVANYIISNSCSKNQILRWFGGEPLLNVKAINIISKQLQEYKINFRSRMITNGVLFNEKLVKNAINLWNLKKVQITLDGTKDVYQNSKSFKNSKGDEFDKVIRNIEYLIDSKINVNIRLNQDLYNTNDLFSLVDFFTQRIGCSKYLRIYNSLLYDSQNTQEIEGKRYEEFLLLQSVLINRGFYPLRPLSGVIKTVHCMADSDNAVTITPLGEIGKCEHYINEYMIGSIYDKKINLDVQNNWKKTLKEHDKCFSCPLYPQCLRIIMCPEEKEFCSLVQCENKIYLIKLVMKKIYKRFVNNKKSGIV